MPYRADAARILIAKAEKRPAKVSSCPRILRPVPQGADDPVGRDDEQGHQGRRERHEVKAEEDQLVGRARIVRLHASGQEGHEEDTILGFVRMIRPRGEMR